MNTFNWHPKFLKVTISGQGILLVGEVLSYFLKFAHYPGLELIGTDGSQEQNAQHSNRSHLRAHLNRYSPHLLNAGLIYDQATTDFLPHSYSTSRLAHPVTLQHHSNLPVVNLSAAQPSFLQAWLQLCSHEDLLNAFNLVNKPTIIFVDDFTQPAIDSIIEQSTHWIMLKITGERLWFSPVITQKCSSSLNWSLIKTRIANNQPERKVLSQLNKAQQIPFENPLELAPELQQQLQRLLIKQLQNDSHHLCVFVRKTQQVSYHPFKQITRVSMDTLEQRLGKPITLNKRAIQFDNDGGSRSYSPEQTLTKLQPLISPITGVVNYFACMEPQSGKPLKTYCARFSKTPSVRQLSNLSLADFSMACAGKGVSDTQSKVSALCEAIERYAPLYQGNEPLFLSTQSALDGPSYSPHDLTPYSELQYRTFEHSLHSSWEEKYAKKPYQDQPIHWLKAWSMSQQSSIYVPMACCISNMPFNDDEYCLWQSNGCAAGNNLEEAILQGLLELIERDAVAIWWYNKISRPSFPLESLPDSLIEKVEQTLPSNMDFWIIDVTNNNQVSVMVAVAQENRTKKFTIGLGCHLNPVLAAQRALTELCQLYPNRDANKSLFDFDKIPNEPFMYPAQDGATSKTTLAYCDDISDNIINIVEQLAQVGLDTLIVDHSREDLPIHTVKVLVPGLCHMWPQLGNQRLYTLPVQLGWLSEANSELTLNQQGLYI
ncbi:YcaO-like family protein [Pseudoalteromonas obscura]|uniref:YcaO-like family protein n=1 Tax=Pseudoalteromonas obscura TaxID=3048491 RepID=A0ABT7EM91_9GAMM|nr:YcaO-like family protein [Pseudoalteromonas sp. P94(2023)]MDK2596172.1 YcaO-like family protein [Pseudoalteromonas sp. P94(2023)]